MAYIPYSDRKIIEEDGNLGLYSDNSQQIYTLIDGDQLFFNLPKQLGGSGTFTKYWWGHQDWDFYAAEKEGRYIKLFTRARRDIEQINADEIDWILNDQFFEILTFDLTGNFIGKELPQSERRDHSTRHTKDAKRLKKFGLAFWSPLEEWGIKNKHLLTDEEVEKNPDLRIEEWAYNKYNLLHPGKPVPDGRGIPTAESHGSINSKSSIKTEIKLPKRFNKKFIDKITNFKTSIDTLEIDTSSFGIDGCIRFGAGKNRRVVRTILDKQNIEFLYDQQGGRLYFNENGSDKGFGDGGLIAILKGAPQLTASNLDFI